MYSRSLPLGSFNVPTGNDTSFTHCCPPHSKPRILSLKSTRVPSLRRQNSASATFTCATMTLLYKPNVCPHRCHRRHNNVSTEVRGGERERPLVPRVTHFTSPQCTTRGLLARFYWGQESQALAFFIHCTFRGSSASSSSLRPAKFFELISSSSSTERLDPVLSNSRSRKGCRQWEFFSAEDVRDQVFQRTSARNMRSSQRKIRRCHGQYLQEKRS